MRFSEQCIGRDAFVKVPVSLDRWMGVFTCNHKGKDKLLQQKGFVKSLINEGNNFIGNETIMFCMREFVLDEDKEDLVCLDGQSKSDGQTFWTITRTENQNSILT